MNKISLTIFFAGLTVWSVCAAPGTARAEDRAVSLTIYNDDLALVREVRKLDLKSGSQEQRFTDVPARMDPTSVQFRAVSAPEQVAVLEQNFEYDLVGTNKLLQKYLDQPVQLFTKEGKFFDGRLLSSAGGIVLEKKDGAVLSVSRDAVQHFEFPKLPGGLITRPTLVWTLSSQKAGPLDAEVSYLTAGMNWHAEYIALLDKDEKNADLSAWVSIENMSGADYDSAKIKLMAGELHRAAFQPPGKALRASAMQTERAEQFEEKGFFEYHLYTLTRPSTIKDNQIKQISLFPTARAAARKIYRYDSAIHPARVSVNIELTNSKESGLGMPLPAGKIRLCKSDSDGSQELVGEDRMEHTAKDEKIRITAGNAFDLTAEKKQKEYRPLADKARQESYEIRFRNHKDEDVEILAVEHLWGNWEIVKSTSAYEKKDANTVEFRVSVPKDGEATLEYTMVTRW